MANNQNLKHFVKGDPHINRGGRPKNLDVMRQVASELCYEPNDLRTDIVARNRLEAILRDWITSNDFRKQRAFMEIAFGKVPRIEKRKKERNHVIIDWGDKHKSKRSDMVRLRSKSVWLIHEAKQNSETVVQRSGVNMKRSGTV